MKIAVLSDTHGLLRPEIKEILSQCEAIVHAGDINNQKIVDSMREIAPLYIVRGNNDKEWAEDIPYSLTIQFEDVSVYVTHKKKDLPDDLCLYDLIINGHTHKYEKRVVDNLVYLNPGCCGPRKETQAITMALLYVNGNSFEIERVDVPHRAK